VNALSVIDCYLGQSWLLYLL